MIGSPFPPKSFPQTKSARIARARLARRLEDLDTDRGLWERVQTAVPEAWAWLEDDLDLPEERVKVSLRLDKSVVAVFRAMGPGYQQAINRVLATYAQMRIGEVKISRPRASVRDADLPEPDDDTAREADRLLLSAELRQALDMSRKEFLMTAPTEKALKAWDEMYGYR